MVSQKWFELINEEVSQYVDGSLPKPTSDKVTQSDISAWELADRKALGILRLGVDDKILYQIIKYDTSKETWDALKKLYGKVTEEDVYKIQDEISSIDPKNFNEIPD